MDENYLKNRKTHKRLKDNREKIIELYQGGMKIAEIARIMKASHTSIYYLLVDAKVLIPKQVRRRSYPLSRGEKKKRSKEEFLKKLNPEIREKMKYNTEINNKLIKRYNNHKSDDKGLIGNLLSMKIIKYI